MINDKSICNNFGVKICNIHNITKKKKKRLLKNLKLKFFIWKMVKYYQFDYKKFTNYRDNEYN